MATIVKLAETFSLASRASLAFRASLAAASASSAISEANGSGSPFRYHRYVKEKSISPFGSKTLPGTHRRLVAVLGLTAVIFADSRTGGLSPKNRGKRK
jgi:hypothetical protein